MTNLNVLIVDDEALARQRLRILLGDCKEPAAILGGEASNTKDALALIHTNHFDAVLLDINMPDEDGLSLARTLKSQPHSPAIIFITAHAEYAVEAFEIAATDYLTKPVRLERLQKSLEKVMQALSVSLLQKSLQKSEQTNDDSRRLEQKNDLNIIIVQDRGATVRLSLDDVIYLKAELKYISVRTAQKTHLWDGSLNELEARYPAQFLRIHRNALVATQAIRTLEKHFDDDEGECWAVRLSNTDELLIVSRRQIAAVRDIISKA
jgi:two-component system, LytTR family, response regulator AlgR